MEGQGKDRSLLACTRDCPAYPPFLPTSPDKALLRMRGSEALRGAFLWGQKATGGHSQLHEHHRLPRITCKSNTHPPCLTSTRCPVPRSVGTRGRVTPLKSQRPCLEDAVEAISELEGAQSLPLAWGSQGQLSLHHVPPTPNSLFPSHRHQLRASLSCRCF